MSFSVYSLVRPLLFCLDAEQAHGLAIAALKMGLVSSPTIPRYSVLQTKMGDVLLDHPLGLAAGFDKQADIIQPSFDLGFSFIELGGVTPLPQPGNPRPRVFRIEEAQAIINRFGFNSVGADVFLQRLVDDHKKHGRRPGRILGINLAKNKETEDAADDYVKGVKIFAGHADFLTVNVSSPNTPGLRDMQERGALTDLLNKVMQARVTTGKKPLVFLKIAPDITDIQARDIADVSLVSGIDGLIVGNTTLSRPPSLPPAMTPQAGGLSGKPLFELSTRMLGLMYQLTEGRLPLIGCGGVFTGADAYAKIRAGASLIQMYTALIYEGPAVMSRIVKELADFLVRDGFTSIQEAVGADIKKG